MKVHGYCETCRKIKLIRANSAAMVRLAMNQPIFGQCDACEEVERQGSRDRHPSTRRR